MNEVGRIKRYCEKREEYGKKKSHMKGGSYNNAIEYQRYGELIVKEIMELYRKGENMPEKTLKEIIEQLKSEGGDTK